MFSIRKNTKTTGFKYRVTVKAFKTSDAMHRFLNKQYDNRWQAMKTPLKSGTYIERGLPGELINIKSIPIEMRAHV